MKRLFFFPALLGIILSGLPVLPGFVNADAYQDRLKSCVTRNTVDLDLGNCAKDTFSYGGRVFSPGKPPSGHRGSPIYTEDTRFVLKGKTIRWLFTEDVAGNIYDQKLFKNVKHEEFEDAGKVTLPDAPPVLKRYKSKAGGYSLLVEPTDTGSEYATAVYLTKDDGSGSMTVLQIDRPLRDSEGKKVEAPSKFLVSVQVTLPLDQTTGRTEPKDGWKRDRGLRADIKAFSRKPRPTGNKSTSGEHSWFADTNDEDTLKWNQQKQALFTCNLVGEQIDPKVKDCAGRDGAGQYLRAKLYGTEEKFFVATFFVVSADGDVSHDLEIDDPGFFDDVLKGDTSDAGKYLKGEVLGNDGDVYMGVCTVTRGKDDSVTPANGGACDIKMKYLTTLQDTTDPVGGAIANVLKYFKGITADTIDKASGMVEKTGVIDAQSLRNNEGLTDAWTTSRNIANIFFLIILLVIAFTNVTRFGIEYYTMRSLLPKFVAAAVLVNLSFFLCLVIIDFTNVLTVGFGAVESSVVFSEAPYFEGGVGDAAAATAGIGAWVIVMFFALLAGLLLWALMVVRILIIWLLIVLAPLAFIANVLPATQSFFRGWWNQFIRFALIAPFVALILKLGEIFTDASGKLDDSSDVLLAPMFAAMTLMLAAMVPALLGGKIMATATGVVKGAMGRVGAAAYQRGRPLATDALGKVPLVGAAGAGRARLARVPVLGRLGAGRLGTERARYERGLARASKMDLSHLSPDSKKFIARTRSPRSAQGIAAASALADAGMLDQGLFNKYGWNSEIWNTTRKQQPDLLLHSNSRGWRDVGANQIIRANAKTATGWAGSVMQDRGVQNLVYANWNREQVIQALHSRESNEKVRAPVAGLNPDLFKNREAATVLEAYQAGDYRYVSEHPENPGLSGGGGDHGPGSPDFMPTADGMIDVGAPRSRSSRPTPSSEQSRRATELYFQYQEQGVPDAYDRSRREAGLPAVSTTGTEPVGRSVTPPSGRTIPRPASPSISSRASTPSGMPDYDGPVNPDAASPPPISPAPARPLVSSQPLRPQVQSDRAEASSNPGSIEPPRGRSRRSAASPPVQAAPPPAPVTATPGESTPAAPAPAASAQASETAQAAGAPGFSSSPTQPAPAQPAESWNPVSPADQEMVRQANREVQAAPPPEAPLPPPSGVARPAPQPSRSAEPDTGATTARLASDMSAEAARVMNANPGISPSDLDQHMREFGSSRASQLGVPFGSQGKVIDQALEQLDLGNG